ncbi:predicted protein [Naegleria gruberi]|uniref:Predicted protein n=1 Tax=Naegleria gruberi TaxID=5762 RepID=D2VZ64_NAEGR|nr:uncharacterized protein NAEGRDRAFT_74374 [Naegleria gruberi]EFC37938.1 predicted protein [Naegleria gruberi]|eukprot:XP_002670682.1 predicted protein [Naegleria gruberi strain NEG-M]
MASKIFITGATGNIGSELIRILNSSPTETKLKLKLLVRNVEKAYKLFEECTNLDIEYVLGEFETISSLPTIFQDVERIFFVTIATPNVAQLERQVVELAVKTSKGLKQVVKISALGASGDLEQNNFFKNLHDSETSVRKALKNTSISYVVIRPNMFIQNYVRGDLADIKNSGVFYRPKHDHGLPYRISHVDTRDISEMVAQILIQPPEQHANQTYNLTGPQSLTYEQVAQIISKSLGKEIKFVELDEFEYGELLRKSGVPPFLIFPFVRLYQVFKLNGTTANVHGDYQLITGKKPRSVEEFFNQHKDKYL